MTTSHEHDLVGLEDDNLLAFLALLGLLRALDHARPSWNARITWLHAPTRPQLLLDMPQDRTAIATAAAEGCAFLQPDYYFEERLDLNYSPNDARVVLKDVARTGSTTRGQLLAALMSDGATRDDRIVATPLCAMFGQGHQHFLGRLSDVPAGVLPRRLAGKKRSPDLNAPDKIAESLFEPWSRSDETDAFRWDPEEDRRYALRFANPSTDAGKTQHGANRLAVVGLACLPSAPVSRGGVTRLVTRGFSIGPNRRLRFTWPIWRKPIPLATILALLDRPELHRDPTVQLAGLGNLGYLGIDEARRVQRISVGKFFNFTRAEQLAPWVTSPPNWGRRPRQRP